MLIYVDLANPASKQAGNMLANAEARDQPALWIVDASDEEATLKYKKKGPITAEVTR